MRKSLVLILVFVALFQASAFAADTSLLEMRNALFAESKQVESLLGKTKNAVIVTSMWDSCLISITQLDAYFSLLDMFNALRRDENVESGVDVLLAWLGEMKRMNDLNVKSLGTLPATLEPTLVERIEKLKEQFTILSNRLASEIKKISLFKKAKRAERPQAVKTSSKKR